MSIEDSYNKNKEITLIDIAKELNVSKSTVSRALQDHHSISGATKDAVRKLAEKYHYQPNAIAASLFKKSTKTIGVIVPILSHYFFSTAIAGIEEVAYNAGYKVIICQSNESYEREVIVSKTLLSAKVDGLIVSVSKETINMDHFSTFISKNIPLVFFDRLPAGIKTNMVSVDDYDGAFKMVEHLIRQGCKKIAHFTGPLNIALSQNRLQGYKDALSKYDIAIDDALIYECGFERSQAIASTEKMLADGISPDAIFAVCDPVAIGIMLTLKQKGINIPDDIAVAGFNDDPTATVIDPPLTTVIQPAFEIGAAAAEICLKQIARPGSKYIKKILKTELIVRRSTIKKKLAKPLV
ncbi:LacI family DNA-binding transcriptional regulator [Mucilaginibacter boryungensis]|uniref:LacI family DNA-binding transcriptional regulator n=1 Tax=Mucilaginibacter boryungensis TaxID=768480 RepID=A0ABR9XHT2_9SPHI|nr:LacI family DNA-binding transcriptional regulator [Mucilaginibacter boryungensis]MBE9666947.1 LacI family DNA-binding transcriptional regulator [Mucilaginibacter boryungensis]